MPRTTIPIKKTGTCHKGPDGLALGWDFQVVAGVSVAMICAHPSSTSTTIAGFWHNCRGESRASAVHLFSLPCLVPLAETCRDFPDSPLTQVLQRIAASPRRRPWNCYYPLSPPVDERFNSSYSIEDRDHDCISVSRGSRPPRSAHAPFQHDAGRFRRRLAVGGGRAGSLPDRSLARDGCQSLRQPSGRMCRGDSLLLCHQRVDGQTLALAG